MTPKKVILKDAVKLSNGKVVTKEDILTELELGKQRPELAKFLGISPAQLRQLMKHFDLEKRRAKSFAFQPLEEQKEEEIEEVTQEEEIPTLQEISRAKRPRGKKVTNTPKNKKEDQKVSEELSAQDDILLEKEIEQAKKHREEFINTFNALIDNLERFRKYHHVAQN